MGFNIAGVLIDRDYRQDVPSLERILGVRLVPEGEVSYEEASENFKEGDYCDVYYCEQGTLVYTTAEFVHGDYTAPGQRVLSFCWYEISDAFYLTYSEDGVVKRDKMYAQGELILDEGEALPEELRLLEEREDSEEYDNTPELITALFRAMIGLSFDELAPDAQCYRYRILREVEDEGLEEVEDLELEEPEEEAPQIVRLGTYKPSPTSTGDKGQGRAWRGIALVAVLLLLILARIVIRIIAG